MCSEIDSGLHSLERAERMRAERADREAEDARDDLADLPRAWPMGHPEMEERKHRDRIAAAEDRARQHRRRADHAAAGYLLVTDAEHHDPEFMQKYQGLIGQAHRAGRLKGSA